MAVDIDEFFTKKQIAGILKISTRSLDRLIEREDWPKGVKLGGVPRWRRSVVNSAIDQLGRDDG
ncbi:MAG: AlpA family transcriptional regulator [Phycisphaera sp. RhM]|nr:AlpA family transcriptional regulator [Phycisphaera sp. RhM]